MSSGNVTGFVIAAVALIGSSALAQQTAPTPAPPPTPSSPPVFSSLPSPPLGRTIPFSSFPIRPLPGREFAQSKFYQNAYQQVQEYGRCLTNVGPSRAHDLLDADPNSVTERVAYRFLVGVGRPCLPYGYGVPAAFLRGGLAEAMYLREAKAGVRVDHRATQDQIVRFYQAEGERSNARLYDDKRLTALTNCLVISAPEQVHQVLLSEHGSSDERAALQRVLDQSPTCATNRRLTNSAATTFIRAYLAESAYRWAQLAG